MNKKTQEKRSKGREASPLEGWGFAQTEQDRELQHRISSSRDDAKVRATHRLAQPIPVPPNDETSVDFVVGLLEYKYRQRDAYRAALAKALGLPGGPSDLQLSIAWHGRLPGDFMRGLEKVLGVTVKGSARHESRKDGGFDAEVTSLVETINAKSSVSLVGLGIVKAGSGELVSRAANHGEVPHNAKDIIKEATGGRPAVVLCKAAELPWVEGRVKPVMLAARVDVQVVVLDDPEFAGWLSGARHMLSEYVAGCASRGRVVTAVDGAEVSAAGSIDVWDLLTTPTLCLHGQVVGVGKYGISKVTGNRTRLHALVYRPDDVIVQGVRVM